MVMDVSISEDISYFLNDKNQSFLLQNNEDQLEIQDTNSLNVEPILTEYVDGTTWTIGEVPVYLNTPIITETEDENIITETTLVETDSAKIIDEASPETLDFSLEIPGKSFLASSGIYLSNEILLHLNLQNDTDLEKPNNQLEIVSQPLLKKNDDQKIIQVDQEKILTKSNNVKDFIEIVCVHKCKNCGALFERYEDILEHLQQVCLDKSVLRRKIVGSPKVQKMSSLLKVDENKMPITKDIFLCGTCENVGYESIEDLREHMLSKHNLIYNIENGKKHKIAEKKPSGNEVHFQNIVSKQQAEGKRIKCLIKGCDSRFSKEELMLRHHKCHVNGDKKKFKCPECDQIFFAWRLCSAHIWKCHKIDIGLFTCAICNTYKAIMPTGLLKHMATHDVAKPFLCSSCGKSFKQLSQLRNHQVSIHKETSQTANWLQKANCTTCNKTFSTPRLLKKHVQAVHNKYKPFICNICGHQCARKAMLELHLRQHTGEKPYKCKICEYRTGDHNSLRRHCGRHFGTPKYSCPHCSYQCVQSSSYKLHIKRKHPGKDGFYSCQLCNFDTVNEQRYSDHIKEHESVLGNATITQVETVLNPVVNSTIPGIKLVPNIEDDETQPGLFSSDHLEDMTVDTGGITIPAGSEN